MKTIFLLLALAVVVATPALAAERTKTYRVEIPVQVRTEIYLRESKRETAAKANRLTGSKTFTRAHERRQAAKPRRYVPRYVTVKADARPKKKKID